MLSVDGKCELPQIGLAVGFYYLKAAIKIIGKELATLKIRFLVHWLVIPTRKVKCCISPLEPNDEIIMRIEGKQGVG